MEIFGNFNKKIVIDDWKAKYITLKFSFRSPSQLRKQFRKIKTKITVK